MCQEPARLSRSQSMEVRETLAAGGGGNTLVTLLVGQGAFLDTAFNFSGRESTGFLDGAGPNWDELEPEDPKAKRKTQRQSKILSSSGVKK